MDSLKRLAIVGAGQIAVEHLRVLEVLPEVEVVGITSRTRERAEKIAKEFKIPCVSDNLDILMETATPDGLLVLVSADQMYPVALEALDCGVPIFLEKPPGMVPEETKHLAELARTNGVPTLVGFNRRCYSIFRKGCEIIERHGPLLGLLVEGHERMHSIRQGGGHPEHILATWLYANATHTIDLLRMFGGEVKHLHSITHRHQEALGDQFSATMEFESGALGTYVSHWLSPGGWRVVLYGQGVTVEFVPLEKGYWIDGVFQRHEIEPDACDQEFKPGLYRQMEIYKDLIRGKCLNWPAQDLSEAYRTMQLAGELCANLVEP